MKCLICSGESAGEVCDKCIRLEKILYQKEWQYKEGMLRMKQEGLRIAISNLRISGRVAICDNAKGLNARLDNVSHYLMNVKECTQVTYQGKKPLMIVIENNTGANTKYTRYCFLPSFEESDSLVNAIFEAKKKAASLTDRIRMNNGMPTDSAPANDIKIINMDELEKAKVVAEASRISQEAARQAVSAQAQAQAPVAHTPAPAAPAAKPAMNFDTVALSGLAEDISEFETKIKKLKVLRDNGILSEAEYLEEKKKLVSIF